ncbi:MAG: hypothetical protein IKC84_00700, partial [Helicobacteraceae bacterium]|nr:hypothetical protein [Helicobacteraceae bacterium]
MRFIAFVCCIINMICAKGSVYDTHFKDMRLPKTSYTSTLYKDKETESAIYYKGTITLSGVLEWHMYEDEVDFYWRLVFFPDMPNAIPRCCEDDNRAIFLNDTFKRDSALQQNSFLQMYNIVSNQLSQADEYILGGIAVHTTLTLSDFYINKHLETEAETPYYASIETDSIKTSSRITKWYIDKAALPSEYLRFFNSTDPYINLRQSPNGKILTQIYKEDMPNDCADIDSKGLLLDLGADSNN